jgi:hypothetical protein
VERSLTILLPIRHAAQALGQTVHQLLDMLPELTHRFEVLLLDDGRVESNTELAHDLARNYPQIRVVAAGAGGGVEASVRAGLEQSQGEIVLLGEYGCETNLHEIAKLWRSLDVQEIWTAHNPRPSERRAAPPRFQVLRQRALATVGPAHETQASQGFWGGKPARPNFMSRFTLVKRDG